MHQFILDAIAAGGYLGIFLLMMAENVFPPIPSEIIMGYAGLLVARGDLDFVAVWLIGTAGTLVGNLAWYGVGRSWREPRLRLFIRRWGRWLTFDWRQFQEARETFRRHGDWIVLALRISPFLRTLISVPAGLAKMPLARFCAFTFAGSLAWNGALIAGGGAAAPLVARFEGVAGWAVGLFLAAGAAWYVWRVVRYVPR